MRHFSMLYYVHYIHNNAQFVCYIVSYICFEVLYFCYDTQWTFIQLLEWMTHLLQRACVFLKTRNAVATLPYSFATTFLQRCNT